MKEKSDISQKAQQQNLLKKVGIEFLGKIVCFFQIKKKRNHLQPERFFPILLFCKKKVVLIFFLSKSFSCKTARWISSIEVSVDSFQLAERPSILETWILIFALEL